jgi:osmoprotectant transport system substrate-binding protein
MDRTANLLLAIAIAAGLSSGCASKPRIIVGSKNFTEQVLLGEIIAQQIERRLGIPVERKLNLGGTLLAHGALNTGGIHLYPEYTGTALAAVLKQTAANDAQTVLDRVREGYRPMRVLWLDPLGFNNTFAMVVRSAAAQKQGLRNLSDAAQRAEAWKLGVGYEFVQRPDGLKGLTETYGLQIKGEPTTMDLGLLYRALSSGAIEMAAANVTDGLLSRPGFTVLADDRKYFPPYQCSIVVREDILARYPQLRKALEELSGRISDDVMRRMNAAVDIEHRSVAEVAREFLHQGS